MRVQERRRPLREFAVDRVAQVRAGAQIAADPDRHGDRRDGQRGRRGDLPAQRHGSRNT